MDKIVEMNVGFQTRKTLFTELCEVNSNNNAYKIAP